MWLSYQLTISEGLMATYYSNDFRSGLKIML
ncbi:elongation factor P, partial [Salmonella enterica subsp. enterica serovar Rubislaw]